MHEIENDLLGLLDDDTRHRLLAQCEEIDLVQGRKLTEAGDHLKSIYFPASGVISLLATYANGDVIEVATVGREGFVGIPAILNGTISPATHMVQMPGKAYVFDREAFERMISDDQVMLRLLQRYSDVFIYEIMISAACNGMHGIDQRLSRWLLMMLDRSGKTTMELTHEFLAHILNVRRASVTDSLRRLEAGGAIARGRGQIHVRDSLLLAGHSCECYSMVEDYRARAMPQAVGQ